jgi:transcriptional regulator with XRE-family HTH domain
MAKRRLRQADVVVAAGIDDRTLRGILNGRYRAHSATIGKLAAGLEITVDDLLRDHEAEAAAAAAATTKATTEQIDRALQRAIDEIASTRPRLFEGWSRFDFAALANQLSLQL